MPFFSSLIKAIFIISLAFPLYSETGFSRPMDFREEPDCSIYEKNFGLCTKERDQVCATNGKTYGNECYFCTDMIKSQRTFGFLRFGKC
ncbi:sperm-associated acrosin inhibitor-like [Rhinolophus ferrumequinum]|uniref:sperm-associated acrosin inhibitor-like n=1 Tax=Rhinolophus ferrumequinum TaxID=59479 RepID=UPI00140FF97E|nr:sperm-associated acrosin inhibitor-like [Rhinolophus ferrumequinum]